MSVTIIIEKFDSLICMYITIYVNVTGKLHANVTVVMFNDRLTVRIFSLRLSSEDRNVNRPAIFRFNFLRFIVSVKYNYIILY